MGQGRCERGRLRTGDDMGGTPLMIETWLNLFGLLSGAFLLIDFQLQAPALHGDSHEKWIKETGLDISAGSRAEDNGPQENPRRSNCQ